MIRSIETVLCTTLLPLFDLREKQVVVIDVLRATTSICHALEHGAEAIIPVATKEEARAMAERGYHVAAENNCIKLDFAEFGNSPNEFTPERVKDESIVYCTTNGTVAIAAAAEARSLFLGAFANLTALTRHLLWEPDADLVLICSGWKGLFNIEDTLFAGAVAQILIESGKFTTRCDSTTASIDLWRMADPDLMNYVKRIEHRSRLASLALEDTFDYCFQRDTCNVVPQYVAGRVLPGPLARG